MKFRWIILLAILLFAFPGTLVKAQKYGLYFASYDSLKENRTGMELFPEKAHTFKNDFKLSFDFKLHETAGFKYGYIFRVILDGEKNIDLIYSSRRSIDFDLAIINGVEQTNITPSFNIDYLLNNWTNLSVHFMLSEDKIIFQMHDTILIHENPGFNNRSDVEIFFGACSKMDFSSTDVPPIMLRDIIIEQDSKVKHHWPLNEVEGDIAKDIITKNDALVKNPLWLKYDHLHWNNAGDLNLSGFASIVENVDNDEIYLLGQHNLVKLDLRTELFDTLALFGDTLILTPYNQAVYDHQSIISYNPNTKQVVKINTISGEVVAGPSIYSRWRQYLHHNKILNQTGKILYILNGYGHHEYKNDLLRFDIKNDEWTTIEGLGEIYEPRYLSASGYLNDTLYVLGGYGSVSGNQMISPQYFYDLNAIALDSFKYERKWRFAKPENDYCFVNSLIIDSLSRDFYTLNFSKQAYNSQLQMIKGSLDNNNYENVGNLINYNFNDINSYADVFYSRNLEKIFAVTLFSKEYVSSNIHIHSINYPPLKETIIAKAPSNNPIYIAVLAMIVALTGTALIFRKKKIKNELASNKFPSGISLEDVDKKVVNNAIYFFGGFQVINRDGVDITKKFSQLLKELFLLILFNSVGDNSKGISSEKLVEHLWFDKNLKSGRNNLSVNIAKLKEILKEIDGCELNHETSYWKLIIDRNLNFIEYVGISNIIEKRESMPSDEMLQFLLHTANKGQFLLNLNYDWLDYYKGQVSDKLVDTMIRYGESLDPNKDSTLIIQICDSVFNFDTINEEAMFLKCKTQSLLGKHSISKKTYESFCKEYEILYGEKFDKSFGSIKNK